MSIKPNLSNPKPGRGAAGRSRARLGTNSTIRPENKSRPYPLRHRRHVALTYLEKHEQAKSYVNRRGNKISGWPLVYQQFITRTRSALCSWLLDSGTTPFCFFKPFSCKACPGITCQDQHASGCIAVWQGDIRQDWIPTGLFA